jgi:ABC-type uncharacterized transport system YnjBCD substrate-binding protein
LPPIRNKIEIDSRKKQPEDKKQLKRDITPMFDYYKAWDKFATETEKEDGDFIPATNPLP